MKLTDLDGQFTKVVAYSPDGDAHIREVMDTLDGAQGVQFQCPKCAEGQERGEEFRDGKTRHFVIGAHLIVCWFRNPRGIEPVGPAVRPGPGRWWVTAASTSIEDLTFDFGDPPVAKSIQLLGGCNWHGFVENGSTRTQA